MSNESVVTQWREGLGTKGSVLWLRQIGTQKHRIMLSARPKSDGWHWEVWSPQGGSAEGQTPTATLPSTKSAATEAGYALLKRLASGQGSMELESAGEDVTRDFLRDNAMLLAADAQRDPVWEIYKHEGCFWQCRRDRSESDEGVWNVRMIDDFPVTMSEV